MTFWVMTPFGDVGGYQQYKAKFLFIIRVDPEDGGS
jgi:hypothetical protein